MNQVKKQKELAKLFSNLDYIEIERDKIIDKVKFLKIEVESEWIDFAVVKDINYWIEKDLKSLQKTLEYINEVI